VANVALSVTPQLRTFPFQITPGSVQQHTAIPRSRLTFQADQVTIVAKIANNTTSISMLCTLPANFAYTFEYATMRVNVNTSPGDAGNFDNLGGITFGFGDGFGSRRCELLSSGEMHTSSNSGSEKNWRAINPYVPPIFNLAGNTIDLTFFCNDFDTAATDEGDFGAILTVLQYDLTQAFSFPMNFPLPVSQR